MKNTKIYVVNSSSESDSYFSSFKLAKEYMDYQIENMSLTGIFWKPFGSIKYDFTYEGGWMKIYQDEINLMKI